MSALYLTVCLTLAAMLAGGAGRTTAKPPELPLDPESGPASHATAPCLREAVQAYLMSIMQSCQCWACRAAHEADSPVPDADGENIESEAAPASCDYTCPYLKQQEFEKQHPQIEPEEPATTLENLQKLEQAQRILRKAERYEKAGETDRARACYERVQLLCPGSRYDHVARVRLRQLEPPGAVEAR